MTGNDKTNNTYIKGEETPAVKEQAEAIKPESTPENPSTPDAKTAPEAKPEETKTPEPNKPASAKPADDPLNTNQKRVKELKTAKNNAIWDGATALIVLAVCIYLVIHEIQVKDVNGIAWVVIDVILVAYFIYTAIRSYLKINWTRVKHQAEDVAVNDLLKLARRSATAADHEDVPGVKELRQHLTDYLSENEHRFDLNLDEEAADRIRNLHTLTGTLSLLTGTDDISLFDKYAQTGIENPTKLGEIHALYESRIEDK